MYVVCWNVYIYTKHMYDNLSCTLSPLFIFQRAELPECSKIHSETLKEQFEQASKARDYRYEEEVLSFLQSFLRENDRKIEGAKKRLALTQETPELEEKVPLYLLLE